MRHHRLVCAKCGITQSRIKESKANRAFLFSFRHACHKIPGLCAGGVWVFLIRFNVVGKYLFAKKWDPHLDLSFVREVCGTACSAIANAAEEEEQVRLACRCVCARERESREEKIHGLLILDQQGTGREKRKASEPPSVVSMEKKNQDRGAWVGIVDENLFCLLYPS